MALFQHDPTSFVYLSCVAISLYGAGLFFWWWAKNGKASSVFAYVSFIFLGELLESVLSLYARYLRREVGTEDYLAFISSACWPGRKIITLAALTAIVIHMSYRAFSTRERNGRRVR